MVKILVQKKKYLASENLMYHRDMSGDTYSHINLNKK
jgi:hypothetical protein